MNLPYLFFYKMVQNFCSFVKLMVLKIELKSYFALQEEAAHCCI